MANRFERVRACAAIVVIWVAATPAVTRGLSICGVNDNDPPDECYRWQCDTTTREWIERPLAAGTACSSGGTCDGSGACVLGKYSVYPKYYIHSVVYLPPGSNSMLEYVAGARLGSSTSTSSSWSSGYTAAASVGLGSIGNKDYSIDVGKEWSGTRTDEESISAGIKITYPFAGLYGPSGGYTDDLNHDYDEILLLLGVRVDVTEYSGGVVRWSADVTQASPLWVLVGWLKGSVPLDPENATWDALDSAGITTADYSTIIAADPFAADPTGIAAPDPSRFACLKQVNYQSTGGPSYTVDTDATYSTTTSATSTYGYTVGLTTSRSGRLLTLLKGESFSFESRSTNSNSVSVGIKDRITIAHPTQAFNRSAWLYLYVDKVYHTFAFSFAPCN